ncbi:MAG: SnoaL-like domain-containing protein [Eudoraea sp.]|nr:SnoaL-like domain-containing protein [Eudoraea sp.]
MKRIALFTTIVLLCMLSCNTVAKEGNILAENSLKTNLNTYIDSCWNAKKLGMLTEIISDDFIRNLNGIPVAKGAIELESHINIYIKAFPNLEVTIDESIVQGNKIISTWTFTGANTGEFTEFEATGKKTKVNGVSIVHYDADGKMSREDTYYNELYLLQQLGYNLEPPIME